MKLTSNTNLPILHVVISILVALVSVSILSRHYKKRRFIIFVVLLIINLIIPIIGHILTLGISIALSQQKKETYLHKVNYFNKDEFLQNKFPNVKRLFGESGINTLANDHKKDAQHKLKGLAFLGDNPEKNDLPLIKKMLNDQNNEVSLYSHALINQIEKELNHKINKTTKEFESAENSTYKNNLAAKLAYLYWEIIYYELSDAETKDLIVEKVRHFASISIENGIDEANLHTLLGKLYFSEKQYKKSTQMFHKAIDKGMKKSFVSFYLAEIEYENRSYDKIKSLIQDVNYMELSWKTMPVYQQWMDKNEKP